jgi:Raf kinase inhibitor-like YbhB/YbcL family protein
MKTLAVCALSLTLAAGIAFTQDKGKGKGKAPAPPGLALSSPDFQDGGVIPDKFTGAAANPVSPKLEWTNVPAVTQAFALIFHDPDVAINKMPDDVLHWMVFNIPGTATGLPGGMSDAATLPDGTIQAKNLRGAVGFMGPGNGAQNPYHHYTFELFALDAKLPLGVDATRAEVLKAMEGHILGKGILVGRFKRPQ